MTPREQPVPSFVVPDESTGSDAHVRRVARVGLAVVSIIAIITAFLLLQREGVADSLRGIAWWGIAGALGLATASILSEGAALAVLGGRWRPADVLRMSRAYLAGGFVGFVTPYSLGGGPAWFWAIAREGVHAGKAGAMVAGRSIVVTSVFGTMSIVAAVLGPAAVGLPRTVALAALVPVGVALAVTLVARRPERVGNTLSGALRVLGTRLRLGRLLEAADHAPAAATEFATVVTRLMRRPGALLAAFGAVAFSRLSQVLAIPLLLLSMGYRLSLREAVAGAIIVWVLASVSPAPSGEGVAQAAVVGVFGALASSHASAAAALAWRACVLYPTYLAGGIMFVRLLRGRRA